MSVCGAVLLRVCIVFVALVCSCGILQSDEQSTKAPDVTVYELSRQPREYDGHLVRVRAVVVLSWEGDNFLSDPNPQNTAPPYVWIYWNAERGQQIYTEIRSAGRRSVYGWFTGIFHFVPRPRVINGAFYPGPLQLEAVSASLEFPQPASLAEAIRGNKLEEARKIVRSGAKLNIWDEYHSFPLAEASELGNADLVEELLQSGADPNLVGPSGDTALQGAAWNCKVDVAKVLLAHGAAVNAADVNGEAALILSSQTCPDGEMTQVLLDAKADPNVKTKGGMTALMAAARNPLVAEKLLNAGADPAAKNGYGDTAESESCDRGAEGFYRVCQLVRAAMAKAAPGK
jgi:hypothetical protein